MSPGPLHVTVPSLRARKGGPPLVMVTAYDAPTARVADEAGVDIVLVGDSVAMVVLGYDDTLQVTVDDMARHVAAVARTHPRPLVVADLPWMSYHLSTDEAVRNAAVLVRAGAAAVKLEGGRRRLPVIDALLGAEIPVMGHLGLTPQSVHVMGGYRVQGQQEEAARGSGRRRGGAGRGRLLRHRAGVRPPGGGGRGHRRGAGAHHRHRGRSRLRRPGAGVPRPGGTGGPGAAQVRPPLRDAEGGRGGRGGRLRGRRAHRALPGRRGELPPVGRRGRRPGAGVRVGGVRVGASGSGASGASGARTA